MRDAPTAVINLLNSGNPFAYADCFTITLLSGTVLRYTNAQQPIRMIPPGEGGLVNFYSNGVLIDGMRMKSVIGIEVDEQDCSVYAAPTVEIDGEPFMTALRLGFFDGASVKRDRAYMEQWGEDPVGAITLFVGRVSNLSPAGGTKAVMKVKSETIVLDQDMPRNTFQTACKNVLFDAGCGLVKGTFAVTDTAESGSTKSNIVWSSATADVYDLGTITFETGPNVGQSRSIRKSNGSGLLLSFPFEYTPVVGDQFKAYPGCDLTRTTCANKFSNIDNFRGFPFVPPAESAY